MDQPAYHPQILRGIVEICAAMGVGRETVQEWISRGAPIAVEYVGKSARYSSEAAALQIWRIHNAREDDNTGAHHGH